MRQLNSLAPYIDVARSVRGSHTHIMLALVRTMPALCLMLALAEYARIYARLIGSALGGCQPVSLNMCNYQLHDNSKRPPKQNSTNTLAISEIREFNQKKKNNSEKGCFLFNTFPMLTMSPFLNQT